jgi:pyruvate/2-oxoglutarate dehydrogenase complex dihydrolipoamide acyltransferase (E2) component
MKSDINLGVAVAIDSGLIVPVVKRSQELDLVGVGLAITDLATRARSKKLVPDDILGGTFSITNPGLFGSLHSNPIINQPQVAILSVGAIIKRPVVIAGDIAIRPLIQIGLTFDHRVIDGEGGAKFLADLKQEIESYAPQVRV